MSEIQKMEVLFPSHKSWANTKTLLNDWWEHTHPKPMTPPVEISRVVEKAVKAGWDLDACYKALRITWAFTDKAFETALRRSKEEDEASFGKVGERILRLRKERQNERDT